MPTKVTIQDIADSLGLSRTTVSKVLNGSPAVSDATRALVLNKAKELNYRVLPQSAPAPAAAEPELNYFALVMHAIPGGIHMGTAVIPGLGQQHKAGADGRIGSIQVRAAIHCQSHVLIFVEVVCGKQSDGMVQLASQYFSIPMGEKL